MVSAELIATLANLRMRIAQSGAANLYQTMAANEVRKIASAIEAFEPFRTIAEGWIVHPFGGGRAGAGVAGTWAWNRLLLGDSVEAIVASVQTLVDQNVYEALARLIHQKCPEGLAGVA